MWAGVAACRLACAKASTMPGCTCQKSSAQPIVAWSIQPPERAQAKARTDWPAKPKIMPKWSAQRNTHQRFEVSGDASVWLAILGPPVLNRPAAQCPATHGWAQGGPGSMDAMLQQLCSISLMQHLQACTQPPANSLPTQSIHPVAIKARKNVLYPGPAPASPLAGLIRLPVHKSKIILAIGLCAKT